MKNILLFLLVALITGCTSIASVNWVHRVGGDNRKEVWVPTCSNCGHVLNYNATQCTNPKDRSLVVWRDKELLFEFPDNPESDYKDELLEIIPENREIDDEAIIEQNLEDDDAYPEELISLDKNDSKEEVTSTEEPQNKAESDFADLDWEEDDISFDDEPQENKVKEDDSTSPEEGMDFEDIDW